MDLKELENGVNPSTHWYYQSKQVPLFKHFDAISKGTTHKWSIIDFGSGSGYFAIELQKKFPERIDKVWLIDIGYTEEEMKITEGQSVEKRRFIPDGTENTLVIMMDVLEHIDDHQGVLEDIKKRVGGNARYFITVPAFMSVWSSHDVYLGHYRRYTIPTLKDVLGKSIYNINRTYYIYGSIFPLVWIIRQFKKSKENMENPESSDMKPTPEPFNTILKWYNSFEMNFRGINKLFGLTCVSEGIIKE